MLCPKTSTFCMVHGSRVTSGMVSVAFMYSVCVLGSPGALVCLGHWFTWCTGSPGALGHWFTWCTGTPWSTSALFTWCTGSPGGTSALVHMVHRFTWGTGEPGALVHWFTVHLGYSMTKHLCCPHYGLWHLQRCKQDSVWLPVT